MPRNGLLYSLPSFQFAAGLARILPRPWAHGFAMGIGRIAYKRRPGVQRMLEENLGVVTGMSGQALAALSRRNVANFCGMLADYFMSAAAHGAVAGRYVDDMVGREHIEKALAAGKGAVIATAHLGNWELGALLLRELGFPVTIVTLDEPSPGLTRWRDAQRERRGIKTIAVGPDRKFSFVEMIQALRRNECVAMLVDRPYEGTGETVTYFGKQTLFSAGPALLHRHTGAAVLPAFVVAQADGRYRCLTQSNLADPDAAPFQTQMLADAFERLVRAHPDQWYNYVPLAQPAAAPDSSLIAAAS